MAARVVLCSVGFRSGWRLASGAPVQRGDRRELPRQVRRASRHQRRAHQLLPLRLPEDRRVQRRVRRALVAARRDRRTRRRAAARDRRARAALTRRGDGMRSIDGCYSSLVLCALVSPLCPLVLSTRNYVPAVLPPSVSFSSSDSFLLFSVFCFRRARTQYTSFLYRSKPLAPYVASLNALRVDTI